MMEMRTVHTPLVSQGGEAYKDVKMKMKMSMTMTKTRMTMKKRMVMRMVMMMVYPLVLLGQPGRRGEASEN